MTSLVLDFADLFRGRMDAYGTDEGRCERTDSGSITDYLRRVTDHLDGATPMGVYPMVDGGVDGWNVMWGCVDFDGHRDGDVWSHACNVQTALKVLADITGWIERTRSGEGFHVWVFPNRWTPAKTMRNALLAACQLVEAPTKEINPKQYELADDQLGNYVRLPYPGGVRDGRQVVLERNGDPLWLQDFVTRARSNRASLQQLDLAAASYRPPARPWREIAPPSTDRRSERLTGGSERLLGPLAYTIWRDGPLPDADRSDTLFKLACQMRRDDVPYGHALSVLIDADTRWGKFMARPNGERYLQQLLERAWSAA